MSTTLEEVIKKLNKEYGETIITKGLNTDNYRNIKRIPFSSPRANYMTYGGIPRGRMIEFAGEESSGKTTTALDIVAHAQDIFLKEYEEACNIAESSKSKKQQQIVKQNVLYVDSENTLDLEWAEMLGVDLDDMILYQPQAQSAEEIFEDIINLSKTGEIGLIILDSLGVLVSGQALGKSIEEKTYGGISLALTTFCGKMAPICKQTDCTFIGINQIRDNMNSAYGGVKTPGGRGWRHSASVRMMFKKGDFVNDVGDPIKKSSENPDGNRIMIDIVKTKSFRPDRRVGYYTLNYTHGIDSSQDLFDICLKYDYIHQGGAWYTLNHPDTLEPMTDEDGNTLKLQGKRNVLQLLDEQTDIREIFEESINKLIYDFDNQVEDLVGVDDEDGIVLEKIF